VQFVNAPPATGLEQELELFVGKGQDLLALMVGEIDRMVRYGEAGHIEASCVPLDVLACVPTLRGRVQEGRTEFVTRSAKLTVP
jgi:hypothetical protein